MSANLPLNVFSFRLLDPTPTMQLQQPNERTLLDEIKETFLDAKEILHSFFWYAFRSNLQ